MAGLLNSMQRLGAIFGGRRSQSQAATRRRVTGRRLPGPRLKGVESLEERNLLSVAPAALEQPNRLIVRFDNAIAMESVGGIAADLGAALVRELPSIHAAVIEVNTAGQDVPSAMSAAVATWSAVPGVRYAEADGVIQIDATTPNDPRFSELWGMHNTGQSGGVDDADIDAPEAWDIARDSGNVVVADIDTGVDYTHPDLAANMWRNPGEIPNNGIDDDRNGYVDDVYGIDTFNNDSDPMDDHGHGTHTSGTIGAVGDNGIGVVGVNWNVKIMALKFMSPFGGYTSGAVEAIDYMTRMKTQYGVNIVVSNNSWGGGGYSQALYDSIKASNDAGILFVASAGNGGYDNDMWPSYPSSYNLPGIIAVAATDRSDRMAYFSQYGRTSVDLGAPGVEVLSTLPPSMYATGYGSWDGTSMAAPHVTGAVALGMAYEPSAPTDYIKQLILNTVDTVPDLVNRTVTGGRLNLNRYISSFNQAPVLNVVGSLTLRSVQQEDVTNFGTRITTLLESLGGDPITDLNVGAKEGVAVIAANTTNGAWQYTINNGVTWNALGNVTNAAARLLAADTATRIRFLPNPGFTGLVAPAITFRAWDQTSGKNGGTGNATNNGGRTAFSFATATASITVSPVPHAPVLDTSVALSLDPIDENVVNSANPGNLLRDILTRDGAVAITDADGDPLGIAVTGADEAHGYWQYWIDNVVGWQNLDVDPNDPTDGPSVSQALLLPSDGTTQLRFIPDFDFHGTVAPGISFRAWDQSSGSPGDRVNATEAGGQTAFSRDISSASITVRWINEAPFLELGTWLEMTPIDEDPVANPGMLVADILTSDVGTPITDNDADMSPGVGIAVVMADDASGAWEYTIDGSDWQPIVGPLSETGALLLAADNATRLRFAPRLDFNTADGSAIPAIIFRAWDRTSGANGGTADVTINGSPTAFSTTTGTVSILVNSVNDAPRFANGPDQNVLEDSGDQVVPGWATLLPAPPDEWGQTSWFDVDNDKPELFLFEPMIDASGNLTYTPADNAFGIATVTVYSGDTDGNDVTAISAGQTFTITIEGVNDAPSFIVGPDQVVDEDAARQVVANWATQISCGPGESGQDLWFVVQDNSVPDMFIEPPAISPDGTLTYHVAPGANGSALITVILQDGEGTANLGSDTSEPQTFEIVVAPMNKKPVAFEQMDLVTDANQALAITLTGDDGDLEEQELTFTIVSQPAKGKITGFDVATGGLVYTPNPGAKGTDTFTFTVTDDATAGDPAGLVSDPATVQIRVDPVVIVPDGAGSNNLLLRLVNGGRLQLNLTAGGTTRTLFNELLVDVSKLTIRGAAANPDQLTVDFAAGGDFALPDGLVFDGLAGGVDTLAVRGTSGADAFVVESGRLTANDLFVPFQNVGQLKLDGGAGADSYTVAALDIPVRITDSSGVDWLDFSQWTSNSGISINLGLSSGQAQQVSVATSTLALSGTIENVTGSPLADVIKGNAAANRLWGGAGNDKLYGFGGNDLLYGEAGEDLLYAGTGVDVLLGGLGNDTLNAGAGRSILIGGEGEDVLRGSAGESIFIGGTTAHDNNDAALMAIVSEWGSSRTFKDRVNRLRTGVGLGLYRLELGTTVFDDDAVRDRMIGGKAKDWFLAFEPDSVENPGAGDVTELTRAAKR